MEDWRSEVGMGSVAELKDDVCVDVQEVSVNTIKLTHGLQVGSKNHHNHPSQEQTTDYPSTEITSGSIYSPEIPVGVHCILELYECPLELLNDLEFIKKALQEAALEAKSTLLKQIEFQFQPQGVTALALLAESHISIHTWPENGYLAADVFTCGEHSKPVEACRYLIDAFQSGKHTFMKMPRGGEFSPNPQPKIEIL